MGSRRSAPSSARVLTQRVDAWARERGLAPKRVRDWISYMIIGGQLARASQSDGGPRFVIKGAVAMEMRLAANARATKDMDVVVDGVEHTDLLATLRDALDGTHQGFTFRVKGEAYVLPGDSARVAVVLEYRGRSWGTVQMDLSPREGDQTEVELVEPLRLEAFGLETPTALRCLSLRYHLAQT